MSANFNFDEESTLINHFYLFGIDPGNLKQEDFLNQSAILEQDHFPIQLLSIFPPEKTNKISYIDVNIIKNHIFPKGSVIKQYYTSNDNKTKEEAYFTFNLDNPFGTSSSNKKVYFYCLLFYEPAINYLNLNEQTKEPQTESEKKNEEEQNKNSHLDRFSIPKVLCIDSFDCFPNEFKKLLKCILSYSRGEVCEIKKPIEKIIENLVYGLPRPPRGIYSVIIPKSDCLISGKTDNIEFAKNELNKYNFYSYRLKTIFTLSVVDICEIFRCLLLEIPILFFSSDKELLTNFFETFMFLLFPFEYQYPHVSLLPEINVGIMEQTKSFAFGINESWIPLDNNDNKKSYFERMNLNIINKYIRIVDLDQKKLDFYYNKEINHHIVNFNDLGKYNMSDPKVTTSADFQSKEVNSDCYDLEASKYKLPKKYIEKMSKKLDDYFTSVGTFNTEYDRAINKKLSEDAFYYFLLSIFQDYNDYLFPSEKDVKKINQWFLMYVNITSLSVENFFNSKKFINDIKGSDEKLFYSKFIETKMFKNFLYRKYKNLDEDKFKFLFFDESIVEKKSKKFFSSVKNIKKNFIEFKNVQITHTYECEQTKDFSDVEYNYIKDNKNELIKYYQCYDEEKKTFTYKIFPKFLYDDKFLQPIENTNPNNSPIISEYKKKYCEALAKLEEEKLFYKIYSGDFTNFYLFNPYDECLPEEVEEILCLLWLRVFCFTFYYCEEHEKIHRFYEMIKNMNKITKVKKYLYEDNILQLIVATLVKYGTEQMVVKFLENIKEYNYIEYSYYCNKMLTNTKPAGSLKKISIANSRISVSVYKDNKDEELLGLNNLKNIASLTESFKLKQRSFNNGCKKGEKEIVVFGSILECNVCNHKFNIGEFTSTLGKMKKTKALICPSCKKNFVPLISINVNGEKIEVSLYNPYYVYKNLSTEIISKHGNRLDLDLLKEKYSNLYWNCIWYFFVRGYSYDMLIKYKKENYADLKQDLEKGKNDNEKDGKSIIKKYTNLTIENQKINFRD